MIQREEKEWGDLVSMQPLTDRPAMQIMAEVDKPKPGSKPGRKPDVRFWFHGAPSGEPLRKSEVNVWLEAMRQFLVFVTGVQAELMNPSRKTSPAKKKR